MGEGGTSEVLHKVAPRRTFEINTFYGPEQQNRNFRSNRVETTKYTCITFFPKNMFVQLSKMANFYFLVMVLL